MKAVKERDRSSPREREGTGTGRYISADTGFWVGTQRLQERETGKQGKCEGSETVRTLTPDLVNEKPGRANPIGDIGCQRGEAQTSYWNVVACPVSSESKEAESTVGRVSSHWG